MYIRGYVLNEQLEYERRRYRRSRAFALEYISTKIVLLNEEEKRVVKNKPSFQREKMSIR